MQKRIAFSFLFAGVLASGGCAQTSRYVTAEHWHDDNNVFIAYSEYTKTNFVVASTGRSTAHVMLCRVQADNKADCRPQTAVDRLLNPDEKIADPAPAAEAAPAESPSGEPQS